MTHLSKSAEGKPGEEVDQSAASNFKGDFNLSNGLMSFSKLSFNVPGASVDLHGTYGLVTENLNFLGTVRLEAEASHTTTGFKSLLLKPLELLLKDKRAGTVVPFKITGNRSHPHFGLQMGKLWKEIT